MAMEPLPHSGFVWHELMTTDADKAEAFYAEVAGISVMRLGDGEDAYRMVSVNGTPVGGLVGPGPEGPKWSSGGPEPHWVASFGVEDADEAARKTKELGRGRPPRAGGCSGDGPGRGPPRPPGRGVRRLHFVDMSSQRSARP